MYNRLAQIYNARLHRKELIMAKKKAENKAKITALYCRLSVEETKDSKDKRKKKQEDESNSISIFLRRKTHLVEKRR